VRVLHTDDEFICTIENKDTIAVLHFLQTLALRGEDREVFDHWSFPHTIEDVHVIQTHKGEKIIIIFGTKTTHLILKKNEHFPELQAKLFRHLPL
jgi:hypothetical protein